MEDVVDSGHGVAAGLEVAYITNKNLIFVYYLRYLGQRLVAHVVLHLLVAGEDADFGDVGFQKTDYSYTYCTFNFDYW